VKHLVLVLAVLAGACGRGPAPDPAPTNAAPGTATPPASTAQGATQTQDRSLTVLLPENLVRQEISGRPDIQVEDTHYSVTQREDELSWSLTGSAVNRAESSIDASPGTPAATLRGVPIYISENEGIKTATWIEKGTAYALDVECTSDTDERCSSSEYILNRVSSLIERPAQ
jgi:hypothetical protein